MKIRDIINENIFTRIGTWLSNKFTSLINTLGFGQSSKISLGKIAMSEAKSQQKGANGRIAEYACAYFLAAGLKNAGLTVRTNISQLQKLAQEEQAKYAKDLTPQQIQLAVDSGNAMAQDMFNNIVNKGQDLVFVNYEFVPEQHSYDIEPTGAQQSKGTSDDMVIHIYKDGPEEFAHKVLISLKVYAGNESSQGSKSSKTSLYKMFADPTKDKVKPADFISVFGDNGREFLAAMDEFKDFGRDVWWNSKEGQAYRQDKIAQGSDPKKYGPNAKTPGTNQLRAAALGDYFIKNKGYTPEHKLSQLFVDLFEYGKINLNDGDWKRFNEGFKQAIGFDEVITYKAVCDAQGVSKVVNSGTSKAYQQMYAALNNKIDVVLVHRPGSSGIGVEIKYGDVVIKSLSLAMWKDGTIQFKFNSTKELE
jgi:hypothetical protein